MKNVKRVIYTIWIVIVILLLVCFLVSPSTFSPESLAEFLKNYEGQIFVFYTVVSLIRGFFLVPSTPFVLAGIILFPNQPFAIIMISMIGIIIGSTAVYYFSDFLGFSKKLEAKYPKKIDRWHKRLNAPSASLIVVAWSFFPFVPTDIICYVAGIVKMPYRYLISGVFIGEIVLVSCYVYFGMDIIQLFK